MISYSAVTVLLLTNRLETYPAGGREMLCRLNHDALRDIYGDMFKLFELLRPGKSGLRSFIKLYKGYIDGISRDVIADMLQLIGSDHVTTVFVDGSNLGELVRVLKCECPHVKVCTFFHNVEARFFFGAFLQYKTLRALAVLMVNYLAERKAVRYSDKIVCLSKRDSQLLQRLYGRQATHISPMALQDRLPATGVSPERARHDKYALFVGGPFYANRAGITWFVKNVAPRITLKTVIVGRGFEDFREELELDGKVEVIGAVESLAEWYLGAHVVIAPIFDGSGMKTKVAEALMFGKKIIGTPEAFSGYEDIADVAGCICATADEFVAAFDNLSHAGVLPFDKELRALYESHYSYSTARSRLEEILSCNA